MAKFISLFVIALLCVGAFAKPKKTPPQEKTTIQEIVEQVEAVRKDLEQAIKKNFLDNPEITNTVIEASKTFATAIEKGAQNLNEQADKNKEVVDNLVSDLARGISESVNYIKGLAGPDANKKGEEVKKSLQTHLDNILVGGKKIEEAMKPHLEHAQEQLKTFASNFVQNLVQAGERLRTDIDKTIEDKKKQTIN